jgi:hypothetical protein
MISLPSPFILANCAGLPVTAVFLAFGAYMAETAPDYQCAESERRAGPVAKMKGFRNKTTVAPRFGFRRPGAVHVKKFYERLSGETRF